MMKDTSLDVDEFSKRRAQEEYPNLVIEMPNDTTSSVIPNLEKGDMVLLIRFNGERRVAPFRVSRSAYNIDKLLRTHSMLVYVDAEQKTHEIREISEYLEAVAWT